MPQRLDQEGLGPRVSGSLAFRLSRLFELKLNAVTGKPYTREEAAERINLCHYRECADRLSEELHRACVPEEEVKERVATLRVRNIITGQYIGQLLNGTKSNPTKLVMEHLAGLFGVDPVYFFDESERSSQLDAELDLLDTLADSEVLALARTATRLSPASRRKAHELITHMADLEGNRTDRDA